MEFVSDPSLSVNSDARNGKVPPLPSAVRIELQGKLENVAAITRLLQLHSPSGNSCCCRYLKSNPIQQIRCKTMRSYDDVFKGLLSKQISEVLTICNFSEKRYYTNVESEHINWTRSWLELQDFFRYGIAQHLVLKHWLLLHKLISTGEVSTPVICQTVLEIVNRHFGQIPQLADSLFFARYKEACTQGESKTNFCQVWEQLKPQLQICEVQRGVVTTRLFPSCEAELTSIAEILYSMATVEFQQHPLLVSAVEQTEVLKRHLHEQVNSYGLYRQQLKKQLTFGFIDYRYEEFSQTKQLNPNFTLAWNIVKRHLAKLSVLSSENWLQQQLFLSAWSELKVTELARWVDQQVILQLRQRELQIRELIAERNALKSDKTNLLLKEQYKVQYDIYRTIQNSQPSITHLTHLLTLFYDSGQSRIG